MGIVYNGNFGGVASSNYTPISGEGYKLPPQWLKQDNRRKTSKRLTSTNAQFLRSLRLKVRQWKVKNSAVVLWFFFYQNGKTNLRGERSSDL